MQCVSESDGRCVGPAFINKEADRDVAWPDDMERIDDIDETEAGRGLP